MIRVSNIKIETPILLNTNSPFLLYIENPTEYCKTIQDLRGAFDGGESEFSFWEKDEMFSPEKKGEIILSPFFFELADKKIINLLHKRLNDEFLNGDNIIRFNEIIAKAENLFYNIFTAVDFSLEFEELQFANLLKVCSVKPTCEFETMLEKVIGYINAYIELKNVSFFVLVGIKTVLANAEIEQLYKHCALRKVELLIIESGSPKKIADNERVVIITDDLCEIVANIE